MIKKINPILLLSFVFLINHELWAQTKITNFDLGFQYNLTSAIRGKIISVKEDSMALIYMNLNQPSDSLKKFKISYSLANGLEEDVKKVVQLKNIYSFFQYQNDFGSQYGLRANVGDAKYFILWLTDTAKMITYPIVKSLKRNPEQAKILLEHKNINVSLFRTYIPVGTSIRVNSFLSNKSIKADYYDYHFLPAKPPMTNRRDSVKSPLVVDKSMTLNSHDSITLSEIGLYYFHLEGSKVGHSIIVRDNKYPKFGSIDRLVEGLRYLATEEEYLKMTTSFNKKELFDEFWLNNTKSEAKARRTIKEYYKRVREANELFTNYKEGWKTDMGMIYVLFGPPSKVFIRTDGLMWIYNKTFELPRVAFLFKQVNTAFTEDHYTLERKAEFQNLWFRTVDLWRTGKKEF
jgi:GWxTD domain-containing protein